MFFYPEQGHFIDIYLHSVFAKLASNSGCLETYMNNFSTSEVFGSIHLVYEIFSSFVISFHTFRFKKDVNLLLSQRLNQQRRKTPVVLI